MSKPGNFSWVDPNLLAGSAQPSTTDHYDFYKAEGINHLISLTQDKPKNLPENDGKRVFIENFLLIVPYFVDFQLV